MRQHTITGPRPRGGIPRLQPQSSIALLSYGFRPFFLGAGVWATVAMVLWLAVSAIWKLPLRMAPRLAHHEIMFGYVSAIVTGFLLTAIPNWTGRLPLKDCHSWRCVCAGAAGQAAMLAPQIGVVAAAVDCSFLPTLAVVIVREIVVGGNWRNLRSRPRRAAADRQRRFPRRGVRQWRADYGIRIGMAPSSC